MISIREMISVLFGRKPMEEFAPKRYPILDGAVNYSLAFVFTAILLVTEFLIFMLLNGYLSNIITISLLKDVAIYGFALALLTPIALVLSLALTYIWGAVHFLVAKFYAGMPGNINDFNGSFLTLMGSITLVQRLFLVIPVIGWIGAVFVHFYGISLTYKFIKARFGVSAARAAIIVLAPLCIIMLLLFGLSVIAAAYLILTLKPA